VFCSGGWLYLSLPGACMYDMNEADRWLPIVYACLGCIHWACGKELDGVSHLLHPQPVP
jgi:hypothetical protein